MLTYGKIIQKVGMSLLLNRYASIKIIKSGIIKSEKVR